MKINLTNGQIINLYDGISAIYTMPGLSSKDKLHMILNRKKLEPICQSFNEIRDELIMKYGELVDDHYTITDNEKVKNFVEEISPILDESIEIDLYQLNINSINDDVDANTIEKLLDIIIEDEIPSTNIDAEVVSE